MSNGREDSKWNYPQQWSGYVVEVVLKSFWAIIAKNVSQTR
jgi:hypothetical protein